MNKKVRDRPQDSGDDVPSEPVREQMAQAQRVTVQDEETLRVSMAFEKEVINRSAQPLKIAENTPHLDVFRWSKKEEWIGCGCLDTLVARDETGSFEKISYGGRVLRNTSAMTAEREALRMGIERLTVLFPTQVSLCDFRLKIQVEQCSTNLTHSLCGSSATTEKRE